MCDNSKGIQHEKLLVSYLRRQSLLQKESRVQQITDWLRKPDCQEPRFRHTNCNKLTQKIGNARGSSLPK